MCILCIFVQIKYFLFIPFLSLSEHTLLGIVVKIWSINILLLSVILVGDWLIIQLFSFHSPFTYNSFKVKLYIYAYLFELVCMIFNQSWHSWSFFSKSILKSLLTVICTYSTDHWRHQTIHLSCVLDFYTLHIKTESGYFSVNSVHNDSRLLDSNVRNVSGYVSKNATCSILVLWPSGLRC